jgi:hypothetical protein
MDGTTGQNQPPPKRGAPIGNQNATKNGLKRIGLTISLSGKRLHRTFQYLKNTGRVETPGELRHLVYQAIDAYLRERSEDAHVE